MERLSWSRHARRRAQERFPVIDGQVELLLDGAKPVSPARARKLLGRRRHPGRRGRYVWSPQWAAIMVVREQTVVTVLETR